MSGLNCFIDIYSAFTLGELHKQEIKRTKAGRAAVAGGKRRVISAVRIQKISRVLVMREKTRGKKGTDTHLVFQAQKGSCSQGCWSETCLLLWLWQSRKKMEHTLIKAAGISLGCWDSARGCSFPRRQAFRFQLFRDMDHMLGPSGDCFIWWMSDAFKGTREGRWNIW